ncbi:hypothetical protein JB92DRAFT_3118170 [Gautieria morchelliformis]|nr:hypothetical protein JB92DRAFT_3118170 [Gautieria morchelliformis]
MAPPSYPSGSTGHPEPPTPPGRDPRPKNGLISARNAIRVGRRAGNEPNVSEDEDILTGADLTAMYPQPQSLNPTQPNSLPTIPPTTTITSNPSRPPLIPQPQPANLTTPAQTAVAPPAPTVSTPTYAFCDADADANTQQPNNHTIPTQLVAMVRARAYIPLSFFRRESMDRIRLKLDLKTTN